MAKIFISHSSLDGWLVEPLSRILEDVGVRTYVAEIETPEGKPLPTKFKENIESSDAVILLLTANVMKRPNTRDLINWEVATAHTLGKPVYVFREKDVEVPLMISNITDYYTFDPKRKEDLDSILSRAEKMAEILKDHKDKVLVSVTLIAIALGILLLAYIVYKRRTK